VRRSATWPHDPTTAGRAYTTVTVVDLVIAVFVLALAAIGWERGLIRSALPLVGFLVGAVIGGRLGPALLSGGSESQYAPVVTVLSGLLLGAALAVTLEGVGLALRDRLAVHGVVGVVDGIGGAILLGGLGLLLAWAFGAVALHAPGSGHSSLRSSIQRSAILGALNDALPPSGPLLNVLRRVDPTPSLNGPEARVAAPDPKLARDPDVKRASGSVVKVLGTACGLGVEGSGWVAGPGLVVTNAHVVAGEGDTTVSRPDGDQLDATAVYYAPRNDLAVLRVPGLHLAPLELVSEVHPGTPGAIAGYPENGPLTLAPARVGGTGDVISQDSYGRGPVRRSMTSFRGEVRSGNSGGPALDEDGRVLTTVFAAQQDSGPEGGLGVPNGVVEGALKGNLSRETDTGPCAT
jgi:S1-C subfamily serine protease